MKRFTQNDWGWAVPDSYIALAHERQKMNENKSILDTKCFACQGFPTNHNEACKEPKVDFSIFHLKIISETLKEILEDQFWGVSPASYISSAGFTRTITERDAEGERDRLIDELERSLSTREWEQK